MYIKKTCLFFAILFLLNGCGKKEEKTQDILLYAASDYAVCTHEDGTIEYLDQQADTEYPDFTDGTWSLTDIETFCKTYGITLTKEYRETNEYTPGKIISQSRAKGTKVMTTKLKIVISKEIEVIE